MFFYVQAKISRMAEVQKEVDGRAAADAARADMEVQVSGGRTASQGLALAFVAFARAR